MMQIDKLSQGDVIAFRVQPDEGQGQINAERWGMFKVLLVDGRDTVTVAPFADLSDGLPKIGFLSRPTALIEQRFEYLRQTRGNKPSIVTVLASETVDLPDARRIKSGMKLTGFEKSIHAELLERKHLGSFMAWATLSMNIDHENRARRDRPAWEADISRRRAEDEARWKAEREREAHRLKGITLDQLAKETPFAAWSDRTAIIPAEYTAASRERFKQLLNVLSALGSKPKRPAVRKELKACVEWFNEVDGTMGYSIETDEREDIYSALEEVCWACKQKPLVQEIENWRDW